jgi:hypothetical protein
MGRFGLERWRAQPSILPRLPGLAMAGTFPDANNHAFSLFEHSSSVTLSMLHGVDNFY